MFSALGFLAKIANVVMKAAQFVLMLALLLTEMLFTRANTIPIR